MRLASFRAPDGAEAWGITDGVTITSASNGSLAEALASGHDLNRLGDGGPEYRVDEVKLLPPIPRPGKIICIGTNYVDHMAEAGRPVPQKPIVFTRYADTQVGHLGNIVRPKVSTQLDYEGELSLVIGKPCRSISEADAKSVIAGYSCYNDASVRDWQRHSHQFTPGKNFPSTGGFGPWLTTPDEIDDIRSCVLTTHLNGIELQRAPISDLIFGIETLIAYCSTFTPLAPGDVIVTGTCAGVGCFRDPPVWMKAGDVVEVSISGIGTLRNFIVDEK